MLSHDEDRHLRAIERWFEESDPALTKMLRDHEPPGRDRQRFAARMGVQLAGAVMFVVGAAVASVTLLVFGVLVLGFGVCLHLAAHR